MNKSPTTRFRLITSIVKYGRLLTPVLAAAGCATMSEEARRQTAFRDIREARYHAFEQWSEQHQQETRARPLLSGELTLPEALRTALDHNPKITAALQSRAVSEGAITEAYASVFPQLTGSADYTRLAETPGFSLPGLEQIPGLEGQLPPDIGGDGQNRYSAGLRLSYPLYRGGAIVSSIRSARLASLVTDETVRATAQEVIYSTAEAYHDLLLAQHLLTVNQDAVNSAQTHLASVREKRRQGMATEFDVLRAQVDVSLFQAEMISQQNRIHLAATKLLRLMGVSQDSDITLTDELVYRPRRADYADRLKTAYRQRPDLFMAELQLQLQQEAVRRIQSRYRPEINAWFDYEYSRPDPLQSGRDQWNDTWRAGLTLSMPLFDGWRRRGQLQQEEYRLQQHRMELQETEDSVMQQVRQGVLSMKNAEEFVASQELNLERADKALQLAEAGYREGVTDSVAVTEARAALTRARGLYYEAVHSHTIAVLNLERVTGILEPLPELPPLDPWRRRPEQDTHQRRTETGPHIEP